MLQKTNGVVLKMFTFIKAVSDTVLDMINVVYHAWKSFDFYRGYLSGEARLPSSGSEWSYYRIHLRRWTVSSQDWTKIKYWKTRKTESGACPEEVVCTSPVAWQTDDMTWDASRILLTMPLYYRKEIDPMTCIPACGEVGHPFQHLTSAFLCKTRQKKQRCLAIQFGYWHLPLQPDCE